MKIGITGANGFLGKSLAAFLISEGHFILSINRFFPESDLQNCDVIVHLAGENIASGRWTEEKKKKIFDSRIVGTQILSEKISKLQNPPKVFVTASAVGFYGDRGEEKLTEESKPGAGFLSVVCQEWEKAAEKAKQRGIRVVHLRFGMILDPDGGALAKMISVFQKGLGGILGNGKQYVSWITLEDAVHAIDHAIKNENLVGPVNAVAPYPVTNKELTKILGKFLNRPTFLRMPAFWIKMIFGEMGKELFLNSIRAIPARLIKSRFIYQHPTLEMALKSFKATRN